MKYIKSINPVTRKVNKKLKVSTELEIYNKVKSAKNYSKLWKDTPLKKRIQIMKKFANLLIKEQKKIGKLITMEMGKPLCESESIVPFLAEFIHYYSDNVESVLKPEKVSSNLIIREPVGVVGIISPWNFPFYTTLDMMVPALLTGNTIVFKPSETTPLCGIKIVNLLRSAGIPKGVINLVIGANSTFNTF